MTEVSSVTAVLMLYVYEQGKRVKGVFSLIRFSCLFQQRISICCLVVDFGVGMDVFDAGKGGDFLLAHVKIDFLESVSFLCELHIV